MWIRETATNPGATTVNYEYDAVGNIRHVLATYDEILENGTVTNTNTVQDYWYKYDAMNRFTTVKGVLSGFAGTRGTTIVRVTPALPDNRPTSTRTTPAFRPSCYAGNLTCYDIENDLLCKAFSLFDTMTGTADFPAIAL